MWKGFVQYVDAVRGAAWAWAGGFVGVVGIGVSLMTKELLWLGLTFAGLSFAQFKAWQAKNNKCEELEAKLEAQETTAEFKQKWEALSTYKTSFMTSIGAALAASPYVGNFSNENDFLDSYSGFPSGDIDPQEPIWQFFCELAKQVQGGLRGQQSNNWLDGGRIAFFHQGRLALSNFWHPRIAHLRSERIAQNSIVIERLQWDSRVIKALAFADAANHMATGHPQSVESTLKNLGSIYAV